MPSQKVFKKKKQVRHESITIRQAQHKNRAEQAHLDHVRKYLGQEKHRSEEDIERGMKRVRKTIGKLVQTVPVPGQTLTTFHKQQRGKAKDVAMHVIYCYLLKQERDKDLRAELDKDPNAVSFERMVTTPDHIDFIYKAFPETFVENTIWRHNPNLTDIYSHGRAGHDMKCMSTRAKPVGGYPLRGPVNFRFWDQTTQNSKTTQNPVAPSNKASTGSPERKLAPSPDKEEFPSVVAKRKTNSPSKNTVSSDGKGSRLPQDERSRRLPLISEVNRKIAFISEYSARCKVKEAEKGKCVRKAKTKVTFN